MLSPIPKIQSLTPSRRAVLLALTACGAMLKPGHADAAPTVGRVNAASGTADLARAAAKIEASAGAPVLLDDLAETGEASRLDLSIGEATRIRLGAKTALRINRFVPGVAAILKLEDGPILVDHGPHAERNFEIQSVYGLIATRGTSFFAGPSKGVFGVFVREGAVIVKAAGKRVRLEAGMGTDISAPGAPPTSPKAWGQPRIEAALQSVQ